MTIQAAPTDRDITPAFTLLDAIAAQREMTAVEHLAAWHASNPHGQPGGQYSDLIPQAEPGTGQQYRFAVNLDQCSGCKACVTACHHQNGLEEGEAWRTVGLLAEASSPTNHQSLNPFILDPQPSNPLQHVTTACHHCIEPACMSACPTNAYEKDAKTGIVWHLDDQCFGCQYCVMACPYEVPTYSESKGIVRKCDMCRGRLASGEAPACVQACPSNAISIEIITIAELAPSNNDRLVPGAPSSAITTPTSEYHSTRAFAAGIERADRDATPQHAHRPLVWMLVLTQLSVGSASAASVLCLVNLDLVNLDLVNLDLVNLGIPDNQAIPRGLMIVSLLGCLVGLLAATLHLGRPWLAYRGVLGWRHSWLSREAIAFGVYMPVVALTTMYEFLFGTDIVMASLTGLTATIGWSGVACSSLIYQFTRRTFWSGSRTMVKFVGTSVVLGSASALCVATIMADPTASLMGPSMIAVVVCLMTSIKLTFERRVLEQDELRATLHLHQTALRSTHLARHRCGIAGGVILPMAFIGFALVGDSFAKFSVAEFSVAGFSIARLGTVGLATGSLLLLWAGEILERTLYFRAAVPLRMPGGIQ
jgi:formate dehydrogenase iron-sulfur subunit